MIIVATELHVRSFWRFFEFAVVSVRSMQQAKKINRKYFRNCQK